MITRTHANTYAATHGARMHAPVASSIVAHGRGNVLRNYVAAHGLVQALQAQALELGELVQRCVDVGDVRLVVLGVVDVHGRRVDVGLQGNIVVVHQSRR